MKYMNHKQSLFSLAMVGALLTGLMGCGETEEVKESAKVEAPLVKPVRTMTVSLGSTTTKSFTGVVEANKTAELGFRVSDSFDGKNTRLKRNSR